ALINSSKPGGDVIRDRLAQANCLPFYDRQNVTNVNGLDSIYWDLIVELSCTVEPPPVKIPTGKLRATFVLKRDEINSLKDLVLARSLGPTDVAHLSSFTVVCALVWVCSARGVVADNDETEYFRFRGGLPSPAGTGNARELLWKLCGAGESGAKARGSEKGGPEGFVKAAKAIGEAIKENVYNENEILWWCREVAGGVRGSLSESGSMGWRDRQGSTSTQRITGGERLRSLKHYFIDDGAVLSLCKSRDFEGGLEIVLSKPMPQMDAFSRVFREVLSELCCSSNQKA
ncbi:anthocyanin 5-aromatic acyltransferase, partial [Phtheirospermum japonicum]